MKNRPLPCPDAFAEPAVTRMGKIACLPLELRTELNRRLDDGWRGPQILTWLNAEPQAPEKGDRHGVENVSS